MQSEAGQDRQPAQALSHRQILTIMSGLLLGMFLASLDQTIVSTAMRTIADRLDGQTAQAWVTTAYLVTSTVSTPHSIYELAAYRAIQGLGAGGLLSLAFAIIGDLVAPRQRAKYQAYFTSVFATSSVLGPVAGGFFAGQHTLLGVDGWRWIFYINLPIGIAAIVTVARNLRLPVNRSVRKIDYLGAGLLVAAVVPVLLVSEKGREWGWGSGLTVTLLVVAALAFIAFLPREHAMGEDAILPLRIFKDRVFSVTSGVAFLVGMAMFGGLVLMPLYLQIVKQESPTHAGLMMTPFMAGLMGASLLTGRIMQHTGRYKVFPIVGTVVMFVGMVMFASLTVDTPIPQAMVYMVVFGAGLGMTMQTLVIAVQNALPPQDMGLSTSSITFFRSMGGTMGAAVSLAVLFGSLRGNIVARAQDAHFPTTALKAIKTVSLDNTGNFNALSAQAKRAVLQGFADSMHTVFVVVACVIVPAFIGSLFIRERPLRQHGGIAAQRSTAEDGERAMAETTIV
jgi:EmrB/QacA subfamily drug resistance transporter